ncbi:hypothetical protein, partial [Paenibacillus sp.]|uniref:hypothetical protein n=1 Tax=Paenibacillus sp. TaxID=58172 RepID=UPI003566415A
NCHEGRQKAFGSDTASTPAMDCRFAQLHQGLFADFMLRKLSILLLKFSTAEYIPSYYLTLEFYFLRTLPHSLMIQTEYSITELNITTICNSQTTEALSYFHYNKITKFAKRVYHFSGKKN